LESVCRGNSTVGSNPTLSASPSSPTKNPSVPTFLRVLKSTFWLVLFRLSESIRPTYLAAAQLQRAARHFSEDGTFTNIYGMVFESRDESSADMPKHRRILQGQHHDGCGHSPLAATQAFSAMGGSVGWASKNDSASRSIRTPSGVYETTIEKTNAPTAVSAASVYSPG